MTSAHQLQAGSRRDFLAFARFGNDIARRHDRDVRPDGMAKHVVATKHVDLVANSFFDDFRRFVDGQSVGIDRIGTHSHCLTPGTSLSPLRSSCVGNKTQRKLNLVACAPAKYSLHSCSHFETSSTRSDELQLKRVNITDKLSLISNLQFVQATPHECAPTVEMSPHLPAAVGAVNLKGAA